MPNGLAPMDGASFIAKTQSLMASKPHELSSRNNAEENERALKTAQKIFGRYPDYSKAPQSYIVGVVELIATYPQWMQDKIADIKTGISARCKFLPTPADIVALAEEINPTPKQQPWFSKPPVLNSESDLRQLETVEERKEFVKSVLGREVGPRPHDARDREWCFVPPPPSFDISDFPDRQPTPPAHLIIPEEPAVVAREIPAPGLFKSHDEAMRDR